MFRYFDIRYSDIRYFEGVLEEKPVLKHSLAVRCENTLWMELDAPDIKRFVLECHDLPFVALCCYLETIRETVSADHP